MSTYINDLIQKSQWVPLLRSNDNIYFAPVIPNKKLQGAMSYLPHGVNPNEVLMLIDDTVFGSAKAGMCLTAKGLFYKASFEDEQVYLFEHIQRVEADIGVITSSILINGQDELNFTQLDKGVVRTLVAFLNECCYGLHGRQGDQQTIVNIDVDMQIMIDLFAYFITFSEGQWNTRSREAISSHFAKLNHAAVNQYVEKLLNKQVSFDYEDLLHRLAELKDKLAYNLRRDMIEQLVYAMALGQVEQTQADLFMTHLCRVSNVSRVVFPDLVKVIYQCLAEETNQNKASDLNHEQLQACQLLGLQPEALTEQTLQVAYRQKMADFHPDKYQTLPESVRQLIEQQAQQLNQARAVLRAYLEI
ncbi:J domain-containing protein [Acinetobacter baumannii]|uniref:J domain-containing protein n=1 Tax=Acinetobacter baumannii TaxID=470 RepID=UPI00233F8568|nr:J domain-containing protein [Acinetobacter baumannii]MDC5139718.1 J domain-containing protein [Acinetobacter baumannii]MDC5304602.1 J domain-containing protein [Acinetobacter baumannii]MDK2221252.1 J domain-containing protein [Acinetobacter baumannii]MDK2232330.1 J domain-containing protein [Acinetobacter baumannii]HEO1822614.1 J domain-containing protein [Acinetobacter baumannii]